MGINQIINGINIDNIILNILDKIHHEGPISGEQLELLSYCKKFHPKVFGKYEKKLIYLMGLFYKTSPPESLIEEVYSIFADSIKKDSGGKSFTPFQGDAYKKINENIYFSFSAPTSTGKSYLFRKLILETKGDIIIIVPSRALIAEYMYEVKNIVKNNKDILILAFIDNINIKKVKRRIFIITPERGVELFKLKDCLNIELLLFDEAQISEEEIRGMGFDTFVRRSDGILPKAKKIFAHPFIDNPEAQLQKHNFNEANSNAKNYNQLSVGKIFLCSSQNGFSYFSPYDINENFEMIDSKDDIIDTILSRGGTALIYVSKASIYENKCIEKFKIYLERCGKLDDLGANKYINKLKEYIGASDENNQKHSSMIDLMEKGIVIHHGSIPLKARYIIEDFINAGYAKICFSTSTLLQGINMPFDIIWLDYFNFRGNNEKKILDLKNLIGRAGRNKSIEKGLFDYGYIIIEEKNLDTFSARIKEDITISSDSQLDKNPENISEDNKDFYEAFKDSGFNDDLYLPNNQIERMKEKNIDGDIEYILDKLLIDNQPVKGKDYYEITNSVRGKIKKSFRNIYISHLRRTEFGRGEKAILSTSIPILLWKIQGKTFKEILGLRQAYICNKDEQIKLKKKLKNKEISNSEFHKEFKKINLKFSQAAEALPDKSLTRSFPLFSPNSKIKKFKYDLLIYDTYDYLDKVLTFSLLNPLSAAFHIYYEKTTDQRALIMQNYIRYGTNDNIEIMLLRYGFDFEDILWVKEYIEQIDENEIIFNETIKDLDKDRYDIIERYL